MINKKELEKLGFTTTFNSTGIKLLENGLQVRIVPFFELNQKEKQWKIELMYDNESKEGKNQFHEPVFEPFHNINTLKKLIDEFNNIEKKQLLTYKIKDIKDKIDMAISNAKRMNTKK